MFLSVDGTFWFQVINFAIFLAILNVVFLKPVGKAIAARRAVIDGIKNDLDRYEGQVATLRSEADARRTAARRRADEILTASRTAAETEASATVGAANGRAAKTADEARRRVAIELQAARAEEDQLSRQLASQLLARATGATQ